MIKKCFRFIVVLVFFLIANHLYSQQPAVFTGRFASALGKEWVYFKSNRGIKDSTQIIKDKTFQLAFAADSVWDVCFISCPSLREYYVFPLFFRQGARLHTVFDNGLLPPKISGDANANFQNAFYREFNATAKLLQKLNKELSETKDSVKQAVLNQQISGIVNKMLDYYVGWVSKHKSSPFSVAIIRLFIYQGGPKQIDTLALKCYHALLPQAKKNNYQAYLLERDFAMLNDKYSKTAVNEKAPDFIIKDMSNTNISLSDLKGSYLLIDFWASWCGPCRKNNPHLKTLYYKYKDKGLKVLSISVDTDAKKWKEAIVKDGMDWLQGSDLMGQVGGVALKYQILAVPHYFLISPEGNVLLKSVGGDVEAIEMELKKLFE